MGKIIVFSGIDSAGKSTQINIFKKKIESKKQKCKVIWSRGGYTSIFELIKKVVRILGGKKLPNAGRNKDRDEFFNKGIISNIWYIIAMIDLIRLYAFTFRLYKLLGYIVIADRYIWDTFVDFKISLENIDLSRSLLWKLAVLLTPKVDKSILLYVSPKTSYIRSQKKEEPFFDDLKTRINRIHEYDKLIKQNKWKLIINTEQFSLMKTQKKIERLIYGIQ